MGEPHEQLAGRRVGSWALSAHIGSGSFAVVWRAQHVDTGQEAAVKEINLSKLNAKLRQSLESEVSILKRINHGNIVKLHEVLEEQDRLYLVMEFCAGGDLAHFLRRVKRVPEATAQHLMRQLAAGLRQMWANHLVHRDLKPQNLLLSAPVPNATLKIADFGFARNLQPQGLAETLCGSPLYMAPEILHFHKYDAKADLWSIGAILYELVVGRPPFTGANQFQLLRNIERSDARVPEAIAAQLSPACRHLIHCLLRRNPVERLSFEEFFRHPFIATPEEAATPLPPRAPYGTGSIGISSSLAAGGGSSGSGPQQQPQQQQQRTLLFSTSAPAAAAAAAALIKSRSGSSIPQQVLGFQQQQQQHHQLGQQHDTSGGGSGRPGAAAAAGAPASVPVGGLSHQLKPRLSADLDGQQLPQRQLLLQQQQRRPQPVAGHRLGSIQRVQGFQPLPAPLPGQQQQQWPPAAAAAAQQTPFAAAAAAATAVGQQRQRQAEAAAAASQPAAAAAAAAATSLPSSGRQPRQQQQQRPAAAAAAGSVHSEDDDYVLVDTSCSAHTAMGSRSRRGSPPASRTTSGSAAATATAAAAPAVEEEPEQQQAESGSSSLTSSRRTCGSAEEDIFAAAHPGDAQAVAAAAPPWLAPPRWRFLRRVAHILQSTADARLAALAGQGAQQRQQLLRECLVLHLAALQLLEHAMEALAAAAAAAAPAGAAGAGSSSVQQELGHPPGAAAAAASGVPQEAAAAADLEAAAGQLQQEAAASMQAAEAAAEALHKAGRQPSPTAVTPAGVAAAEAEAALPDPWELLYGAALGWGREAAVDELLGNLPRSCQLYARAGCVLSFLCTEAAGLELEPPAELAPADRLRLAKYAAATAVRWAACLASAGGGDGVVSM